MQITLKDELVDSALGCWNDDPRISVEIAKRGDGVTMIVRFGDVTAIEASGPTIDSAALRLEKAIDEWLADDGSAVLEELRQIGSQISDEEFAAKMAADSACLNETKPAEPQPLKPLLTEFQASMAYFLRNQHVTDGLLRSMMEYDEIQAAERLADLGFAVKGRAPLRGGPVAYYGVRVLPEHGVLPPKLTVWDYATLQRIKRRDGMNIEAPGRGSNNRLRDLVMFGYLRIETRCDAIGSYKVHVVTDKFVDLGVGDYDDTNGVSNA